MVTNNIKFFGEETSKKCKDMVNHPLHYNQNKYDSGSVYLFSEQRMEKRR